MKLYLQYKFTLREGWHLVLDVPYSNSPDGVVFLIQKLDYYCIIKSKNIIVTIKSPTKLLYQ